MIDTDKYEGHLIDKAVEDNSQVWVWKNWMLKNAETIEQHKATAALLSDAPKLLAEVKRLREELSKAEQERDKYSGVLNLAIPYIGHTGMGIEFEEYMKDDYGITVYGDEYLACDCEGCSGLVKDKYDNYIIKGRGNQESVKCDYEDCPYFYGGEEE